MQKNKLLALSVLVLAVALPCGTFAAATETETEATLYYGGAQGSGSFYDETEAETEPRPEFNASDYLKITDDKYRNMHLTIAPLPEITEEDLHEEIASRLDEAGLNHSAEGVVEDGDTVNIDFVGKKEGVEFDGGSAEDVDLDIGSGSFIDGFEEGLIGKSVGESVLLELTFPEDYGVEELNGQAVTFDVTINYTKVTPELTDELAEELSEGEYTTLEAYKDSVRAEIQAEDEESQQNDKYYAILDELMGLYPVEEYPKDVEAYELNAYMAQAQQGADQYGMELEDYVQTYYGVDLDYLRSYYQMYVDSALEEEIIIKAIAEKEGISMTDEEVMAEMEKTAMSNGLSLEDFQAYFGVDVDSFRSYAFEIKVLNTLSALTTFVEEEETEADIYYPGTEADDEWTEYVADLLDSTEAETETEA